MNTEPLNKSFTAYENNKEKLINDLKDVVADASGMLKDSANSSVDAFAASRNKLQETMSEAKEQFARSQLGERARHAVDTTSDYVKAHPWKSVGAVATAAVAFHLLFGRRH